MLNVETYLAEQNTFQIWPLALISQTACRDSMCHGKTEELQSPICSGEPWGDRTSTLLVAIRSFVLSV